MDTRKTHKHSAVDFPGSMRMYVALTVEDLEKSTAFYTAVFDQPPTKERKGYAKFEPEEPSVYFTLNKRWESGTPINAVNLRIWESGNSSISRKTH